MDKEKLLVDTSVFMSDIDLLKKIVDENQIIIHNVVLEELNKLKDFGKFPSSMKARNAIRFIRENIDELTFLESNEKAYSKDNISNDDVIVKSADLNGWTILTKDIHMYVVCRAKGISVIDASIYKTTRPQQNDGYLQVDMDDVEMAEFYRTKENKWDIKVNEYLIVANKEGKVVDKLCWTGREFRTLKYNKYKNATTEHIKPLNIEQELLFDMLQTTNTDVKLVTGGFGTGKDIVMLADAFTRIEAGEFSKIVYVRNNIQVADTQDIGFLPGTMEEKIMPFIQPLADHVGGMLALEMLMNRGVVEIQHLGFIRGRDIEDAIIYITEAENMTKEQVQLVMGRVGKGSQLYINGDFKQVDDEVFKYNSGMLHLMRGLRGHNNYSHIDLKYSERSEVARMSELI